MENKKKAYPTGSLNLNENNELKCMIGIFIEGYIMHREFWTK